MVEGLFSHLPIRRNVLFIRRSPGGWLFGSLLAFTQLAPPVFGAETLTPAEVFKHAVPGVVAIDCLGINNARISTASGFIISDNGRIATNLHVVESCSILAVRLTNGDVYDSTWVVATDKRRDLAVIRIKAASLPVLPLAESNDLEVGQTVYSIGNPSGLQNTLQSGIVSAFRQVNGSRLVQISASLNPGNSGGPVLDEKGHVAAIAVSKINGAENLGFAIPIDYLKGYLDSKEETAFSVFAATNKQNTLSQLQTSRTMDTLPRRGTPTTWVGPVYSQLLSFSVPPTFRQAAIKSDSASYSSGWIPENETTEKWTKMVVLTGARGLASTPNLSPKTFADMMAQYFKKSCPDSFTRSELFEGKISGHDAFITVFHCGVLIPPAQNTAESAMIALIKGASDYYSIQWLERGAATQGQIEIDKASWLEKFKKLEPIKLCPVVPGEQAPYASCVNANPQQARDAVTPPPVAVKYPDLPKGDGTLAHATELAQAKRFGEAFSLFLESANGGNTQAQRYVGDLYRYGLGVVQDFTQARLWYEKASAGGDPIAANGLGLLYYSGQGGAQDYAKARLFFERSATAGNEQGMLNLGDLYQRGLGGAQDYQQARNWLAKAAAAGDALAMNNLGYLYQNGLGGPVDFAQARQLFEKAESQGIAAAMNNLGLLYLKGNGVALDYGRARDLFERAASAGNAIAMNSLAYTYEHALGVTQDYAQARAWYEKSAAGGYTAAKTNLERLPR
jgi:TPR repeat protein